MGGAFQPVGAKSHHSGRRFGTGLVQTGGMVPFFVGQDTMVCEISDLTAKKTHHRPVRTRQGCKIRYHGSVHREKMHHGRIPVVAEGEKVTIVVFGFSFVSPAPG